MKLLTRADFEDGLYDADLGLSALFGDITEEPSGGNLLQ